MVVEEASLSSNGAVTLSSLVLVAVSDTSPSIVAVMVDVLVISKEVVIDRSTVLVFVFVFVFVFVEFSVTDVSVGVSSLLNKEINASSTLANILFSSTVGSSSGMIGVVVAVSRKASSVLEMENRSSGFTELLTSGVWSGVQILTPGGQATPNGSWESSANLVMLNG